MNPTSFAGVARLVAAVAAGSLASVGHAQTTDGLGGEGRLRFSGFGSLGVSHVEAPEGWGFRREITQGGSDARWRGDVDTRLGAQINFSATSNLELVAQAVVRKRGSYAQGTDVLEWAYAAYRPADDWTVRAGRLNFNAFLMADYRNVGYGYLTARPPVELYSVLSTALDGGDVSRTWLQGDAQWRAQLIAGRTRIGDVNVGKADHLRKVVSLALSREEQGLMLRASASRARFDIDISPVRSALDTLAQLGQLAIPGVTTEAHLLLDRASSSGFVGTFYEIGVRHELADWQWSAEVVRVSASQFLQQSSFYATAGRRFGSWTPYAGYGRTRDALSVLNRPDWQAALTPALGAVEAAQAQALGLAFTTRLNNSRIEQSTWTLGARWDFHPQAALKIQWDRVRVAAAGSGLWANPDGTPARAHVATAVVDFIF